MLVLINHARVAAASLWLPPAACRSWAHAHLGAGVRGEGGL
eukprot:COSAG01_NODE_61415_length_289_cov_1.878947_1_plen_40_part_10